MFFVTYKLISNRTNQTVLFIYTEKKELKCYLIRTCLLEFIAANFLNHRGYKAVFVPDFVMQNTKGNYFL